MGVCVLSQSKTIGFVHKKSVTLHTRWKDGEKTRFYARLPSRKCAFLTVTHKFAMFSWANINGVIDTAPDSL